MECLSAIRFRFVGGYMTILGKEPAVVTKHIRNLRGGSQPILVRASDGLYYIAKFANNLQGPNLLFNESVGNELYRACGLAVPSWKPLVVTDRFLDKNPKCWMHTPEERLRPTSGLCFGSQLLGREGTGLLEILPESSHSHIRNRTAFWLAWLIDVCAEHVDNRQAVFVVAAGGWLDAFFVDHGHLFGGPEPDRLQDFSKVRYLDPRIYPDASQKGLLKVQKAVHDLDIDSLWQTVMKTVPTDWRLTSALDRFAGCLQRLADSNLLQSLLETIIHSNALGNERTHGSHRCEQKLPVGVLRHPLLSAGQGKRRPRNHACASG